MSSPSVLPPLLTEWLLAGRHRGPGPLPPPTADRVHTLSRRVSLELVTSSEVTC